MAGKAHAKAVTEDGRSRYNLTERFRQEVRRLETTMYGTDVTGIQIIIVDTRTHEPLPFAPLPRKDPDAATSAAEGNVDAACSQFLRAMKITKCVRDAKARRKPGEDE